MDLPLPKKSLGIFLLTTIRYGIPRPTVIYFCPIHLVTDTVATNFSRGFIADALCIVFSSSLQYLPSHKRQPIMPISPAPPDVCLTRYLHNMYLVRHLEISQGFVRGGNVSGDITSYPPTKRLIWILTNVIPNTNPSSNSIYKPYRYMQRGALAYHTAQFSFLLFAIYRYYILLYSKISQGFL